MTGIQGSWSCASGCEGLGSVQAMRRVPLARHVRRAQLLVPPRSFYYHWLFEVASDCEASRSVKVMLRVPLARLARRAQVSYETVFVLYGLLVVCLQAAVLSGKQGRRDNVSGHL